MSSETGAGSGAGLVTLFFSSSDDSVEAVNIFLCAFLNSAMSMSCFSFLSVMNGAFFMTADDTDWGPTFSPKVEFSLPAAFCFLLLISSCKAAARLPLLPDEADSSEMVLGLLPTLLWLEAGALLASWRLLTDLLLTRLDFPRVFLRIFFSSSSFFLSSVRASASFLSLSCSDCSLLLSSSISASSLRLASSWFLVF